MGPPAFSVEGLWTRAFFLGFWSLSFSSQVRLTTPCVSTSRAGTTSHQFPRAGLFQTGRPSSLPSPTRGSERSCAFFGGGLPELFPYALKTFFSARLSRSFVSGSIFFPLTPSSCCPRSAQVYCRPRWTSAGSLVLARLPHISRPASTNGCLSNLSLSPDRFPRYTLLCRCWRFMTWAWTRVAARSPPGRISRAREFAVRCPPTNEFAGFRL